MKKNSQVIALGFISLAACWLYFAYRHFYPVGYFNDDASYLLAAKSLLQGRYVFLSAPDQARINIWFPGYPALLALVMIFCGAHWAGYIWISMVSTIGIAILTVLLFRKAGAPTLLTALLIGASPLVALYSGSVMTEPLYTVAILAVFIFSKKLYEKNETPLRTVGVGLLISGVMLIRPAGLLLTAAVLAGLGYQRRWKTALLLGGVSTLGLGMFIHNYSLTHTPSAYLNHWDFESLGAWGKLGSLWTLLEKFFADSLLGLSDIGPAWGEKLFKVLLTLSGLFLVSRGFMRLTRRYDRSPGFVLSIGLFLLFHVVVHALWIGFDYRYILPILPLALGLWILGLQETLPNVRFQAMVCLGVLVFNVRWHQAMLQDVSNAHNVRALPMDSFRWVVEKTSPDAIWDIDRPATLFLYTGRRATSTPAFDDPDLFRYWLLKKRIAYVFYQKNEYMHARRTGIWQQAHQWMIRNPAAYPLQYSHPEEGAEIYQVQPDPDFIKAYESRLLKTEIIKS